MKQPSYVGFKSKEYHWKPDIDYRENPHLYKVGRGQQGVLICQPYKSELHIHWRFRTPEEAHEVCSNYLYDVLGLFKTRRFCRKIWQRSIYIWDLQEHVDIGIIVQEKVDKRKW